MVRRMSVDYWATVLVRRGLSFERNYSRQINASRFVTIIEEKTYTYEVFRSACTFPYIQSLFPPPPPTNRTRYATSVSRRVQYARCSESERSSQIRFRRGQLTNVLNRRPRSLERDDIVRFITPEIPGKQRLYTRQCTSTRIWKHHKILKSNRTKRNIPQLNGNLANCENPKKNLHGP